MRLDAYIRVSRVAGREGESFISPDVQRERIAAYASVHGHEVTWHPPELDQPGSRYERPQFQAALGRVERGETGGVIVAKADRFARSIVDALAAIKRIENAGGQFISVAEGFDTTTPAGKLALTIFLAFAEFELDRIREMWDTSQAHAVARGVHIASRTPTGYRRRPDGRLEPDPDAAAVVRELFRRRAAGAGWSALAEFMDAAAITGPYGNRAWTAGTLAKIIRNPVYLGEARSGKHVNREAHEAIVTAAEWRAAQGQRGVATARNGDGLLLAGLVRCTGCRYVVKPDTMRDRDGSRLGLYRCRGRHPSGRCPAPTSTLARVLEPYVETHFLEALGPDGPLAEATMSTEAVDRTLARVEQAEAELVAFRDTTAVSVIGRASFMAGLEARARELDDARRELAEARERAVLSETLSLTPGGLLEAWPGLSIPEKRTILTAAIDAVFLRQVRGSGRSVPVGERVLILWRGQGPHDLPRRGRRVALASFPWPESPADVGVAAGEHA